MVARQNHLRATEVSNIMAAFSLFLKTFVCYQPRLFRGRRKPLLCCLITYMPASFGVWDHIKNVIDVSSCGRDTYR